MHCAKRLPTHSCADVVGITNYVDIGFQMVSDMQSAQGSVLRFGASWQVRRSSLRGVGGRFRTCAYTALSLTSPTNTQDASAEEVCGCALPHRLPHNCTPQANKNVMLKARAGLDGVSAAAVFRSWWQPAFTAGLAASYDLRTGQPRFGATAAIESYRHLRQVIGWWQVCDKTPW